MPIPSDTIIGLYHPFRDLFAKQYPNGVPYKNYLITDPVRQEYPWRYLEVSIENIGQLPLWNPYTFGGSPLLANFQSAVFYPFNISYNNIPLCDRVVTSSHASAITSSYFFIYLSSLFKIIRTSSFLADS